MSLKNRIARIEKNAPKAAQVHFFGWADCQWREAAGLVRAEGESQKEFFTRVGSVTDSKWIWCD